MSGLYFHREHLPESLRKLSAMDRKAELERKKAKLAALREEKDRRRREKEIKDIEEATNRIGSASEKDSKRYVLINRISIILKV